MSLSVLAIYSILFLKVSRASVPSYFNHDEPDRPQTLYRGVFEIFSDSPDAPSLKVIGLISDNAEEFTLPMKMLHEFENKVVIWQYGPIIVDSTFVEIKWRRGEDAGEILDGILSRVVMSHTVVLVLINPEDLYLNEIEAFMLEVFEKFWKELMTNVAIAFLNTYRNSATSSPSPLKVLTYVYEPYNPNALINVTGQRYRGIFYDKTANLHRHPLNVLAHVKERLFIEAKEKGLETSGIDGHLTRSLGKIFNATIKLSYNLTIEAVLQSDELKQIVELYDNGSIDLWMNIYIIRPYARDAVTYTYPRQQNDAVCILPKNRDRRVKYKSIGGGRVVAVTLMMVVLFSVMSFFIFLSNAILKKNFSISKLAKLLINQSDAVTHSPSSTTTRVLLGTWIIGSFVCSTLLQTLLTSRIIKPSVDERLTTIDELIESKFDLRIEEWYWKLTRDHFDEDILDALRDNIEVVASGDLFKAQSPDVGYISAEYAVSYIDRRASQFYLLQQVFLPNFVGYYLPNKSPFFLRLNTALAEITESGIVAKWLADSRRQSFKDLNSKDKISSAKLITYKNLASVIYLYGTCMVFAFVVFMFELKSLDN